ncbi:hypothetical protein BCR35DRAFT_75077 [Leucosporidium creatinivorum]|uniref:RNase III domain-containing protein n=1 Tax=Leucosporidium creatinivorum TaxID=106004 RepID=A0A1Y2G2X0_9BASI|nr:hypothetical protein BCR35DRAFT_75077 [Leucosporidium creatinivorum]
MVDLAASISHSSPTLSPLRAALQACISTLQLSLPPLKDFATWRTHTSYHGVVHDAFERPQGMPVWDYERREHVGDIVLGYYVTRLIDQRYPGLVVGMRSVSSSSFAGP